MKVSKLLIFLLYLFLLLPFHSCSNANSDDSETVYITASGSRYHRSSCSTIKGSSTTALSRESAKAKGYSPCSVCKP